MFGCNCMWHWLGVFKEFYCIPATLTLFCGVSVLMPPAPSLCVCPHSWGRWKDILTHGRFKWQLAERDMEVLCRALLVYCVRHYMGDDKIKSFIWDLITPAKDGHKQDLQNHSGEKLTNIP